MDRALRIEGLFLEEAVDASGRGQEGLIGRLARLVAGAEHAYRVARLEGLDDLQRALAQRLHGLRAPETRQDQVPLVLPVGLLPGLQDPGGSPRWQLLLGTRVSLCGHG
jgi:hypothetical protein